MAAAEAEAKEVLIAPEKHICKCAYIINVSSDKSFVVADLIDEGTKKRFKAKGKNTIPPYVAPMLTVEVTGVWEEYKRDGKTCKIFDVTRFEPLQYESTESFVGYLQTCYKGIGPKTAAKILNALDGQYTKFGEKINEEGYFNKAIGKKLAKSLVEQYKNHEKQDEVYKIMQAAGISEKKINEFRNTYGKGAMEVLESNPYVLYTQYKTSFNSAEAVCMMMLGTHPELLKSQERIDACVHYLLKNKVALQGHTYVNSRQLLEYTLRKLNENKVKELWVNKEDVSKKLYDMCKVSELVCGKIKVKGQLAEADKSWWVYDAYYYKAEEYISKRIAEMANFRYKYTEATKAKYISTIKECEKDAGIELEAKQREAVMSVLSNKISVITGSAGTGKTTVLKVCIAVLKKLHKGQCKVTLTAPTGRAAMRMSLATGLETGASTIHSLLGLTGQEDENVEVTPNQVSTDVLFIDEASMCELSLFYKLLYNTDEHAKIVLIGDPNQLPPVGAGEVLKSIIESESVPVTKLSVIYRQLETSSIVYNATKIMTGKRDIRLDDDFVYYRYSDPKQIKAAVLYAFEKELETVKDVREVQIITPLREKGELSALSFNKAVQEMLNPLHTSVSSSGNTIYPLSYQTGTGLRIRKGDKIICQKNTPEIKNGEIGIVMSMTSDDNKKFKSAVISFERRDPIEFTREELSDMNVTLGYAITVHKAQGSEFKSVLMPIAEENKTMLRRNLFYTSVTRAKEKFTLVGDEKEITYAIKNNSQDYRRTCLASKIKEKVNSLKPKSSKSSDEAKKHQEYQLTLV